MKHRNWFVYAALISALGTLTAMSGSALAAGGPCNLPNINAQLTAPTITCLGSTGSQITLQITGTGTYGAPNGFTLQMKPKLEFDADYAAGGGPLDNRGWEEDASFRCWSLAGNCSQGTYNLDPNESVTLIIDADFALRYADGPGQCGATASCGQTILLCGTEYIFRINAKEKVDNQACPKLNLDKSEWGPFDPMTNKTGKVCATAACPPPDGGCTYTWGYWKTHGPEGCSPGNQINDWDVTELMIGGETLDVTALCAILQENPSACGKGGGANAVLILEHQLIAAMLNVANDAISCASANQAIVDANNMLSGSVYSCVGTASVLGQQMLAVKDILAAYNSDICDCSVPSGKPQATPTTRSNIKRATWGDVKSIYR